MTAESQINRYCTIFTLDGTASLFAQYISNSIIAQTFITAPTPSIITAHTQYYAINIARVLATLI
jgi:hypothetical protein